MAIIGYKVAGTVGNVGTVNWGVGDDLKASVQGTAASDGWATHLGARLGGDPLPASAALAAYQVSGGTLTTLRGETATIALDVAMVNTAGGKNYEVPLNTPFPVSAGDQFGVAIGARSGTVNFGMGSTGYPMHRNNWGGTFPNPYAADSVTTETKQVAWIVYQLNTAPTATITSHSAGQVVTDLTPEITVAFSDVDTAYGDGMSHAEIAIHDAGTATLVETSGKVAATGSSFSWTPTTPLTGGTEYVFTGAVWDAHDVRSTNDPGITVIVGGQGTLSDLALTDVQGYVGDDTVLNTTTPGLTGTWAHALSDDTASYTLRVVNDATDAVVRSETTVAQVDAVGAVALAWPAAWNALSRGATVYRIEVKATDALGGQTDWATTDTFLVNAAPNTPAILAPTDAIVTDYPTLISSNADPTDAASLLTVSHEVRPAGGSAVAATTTHDGSGQFSSVADATQFPAYGEYQWRAVATDPWGLSTEGPWQSLSFLEPPSITAVSPVTDETLTAESPTVSWTFNRAQSRYRITVREQGGARVYYLSWIVQSPDTAHTIPVPLPNRTDYDLVIWAETAEGGSDEITVPFRLEYESTEARSAEEQSLIATEGEARAVDEYDEIVIDGVSVPVRSIQRTDTSRFEGKVTFGDYTVDSDQLLSTWAQSTWVGGMNIENQIEGATDSRFRWARAWTQSTSQMTLPLASTRVDLSYTEPPAPTITPDVGGSFGEDVGEGYLPWAGHERTARPVGARAGIVYATCGMALSAINTRTATPYLIGDLAAMPVNVGAWHGVGSRDSMRLYLPLGEFGIQAYHPATNTIEAADTTVEAVAVLAFDTRLYAVTVDGELMWLPPTGVWSTPTTAVQVPASESVRHLMPYFDRNGDPSVVIVTTQQAWVFQADPEAIVPLGMHYPLSHESGEAAAVWRDDGLYVADTLAITRLSTAGVITPMGLDRDDGLQLVPDFADVLDVVPVETHRITDLAPSTNALLANVRGYVTSESGITSSHNVLLAWNEAGWHYVAALDRDSAGTTAFEPCGLLVADGLDGYVAVAGSRPADPEDSSGVSGAIYLTVLPEGLHAPRKPLTSQGVVFEREGVFLSGWVDAGMRNFYKAWSHAEVTLARVSPDDAAPPGVVDVAYRTEDDPSTWHALGTADQFGRNVFPINTINEIDRGLMSTRIEIMLTLRDTTGASTLTETPIIEALVLKFIKLAQHGSAWQVYVPMSDYDTHRGVGPTQIDDFLSRLTAEGSVYGPFQEMIHLARTEDGWEERGRHRIRVAQWQRSEATGKNPYGDGVLNIIAVKIPLGDPA